ncbi:C3HC zinc finger-like-domain-containing protein [Aspergillus bertholletiae]|uniref:C3HC zinc finger-like-domain-containing protein n=1 Tax=Aspergillus bertholletiae TaxID=1226010 RepID=A0A5N7B1I9_9EURO|nr:C3HC zinc finger-like-domain-containing protein [Aspergillus bertholletiae]
MSYAVETKKRKFHRVLESLTKPSTIESSTKPTPAATTAKATTTPTNERISADLATKKARLTDRQDGTDLLSVRKTVLSVARSRSRDSSVSSSRPSYVPWDRERFLERLETFRRVDRWSPKPSAINEFEWAKRGWVCTDVSRVACVGGCGGSVVVKLPDELDELDGYDSEKVQERKEVRAKLVEEYASLLVNGHGENCPWRNKGCDATIHRLALSNPDAAISGLRTRYLNIAKMADQLPSHEVIQTPGPFDLETIIKILPDDFETIEKHTEIAAPQTPQSVDGNQLTSVESLPTREFSINRTAFALAFFGWDSVADGAAGLAGCGACFRRLGLWMYKPKDNGDMSVYDVLDVATEHMEYCPWVNGKAQSGTGKPSEKSAELRSGWELLAQALKVKHRRYIRSTVSVDSRAVSETPSADGFAVDEANSEAKKASDREWWAKLRRMRQVLNVKSPKKPAAP